MAVGLVVSLTVAGAVAADLPQPDAEYNIPTPWRSRGLPPVTMAEDRELAPLVLAESGVAKLPIVSPPHGYYRQIADLLKRYLDQAAGTTFRIVSEAPLEGRAIFVGDCGPEPVRAAFREAQSLPLETLTVTSLAEGLVLAGRDAHCGHRLKPRTRLDIRDKNQSRGTLFAALDFLERMIGCRFYFPGIGLHVPNLSGSTVALPPFSWTDAPVFPYRSGAYGVGTDERALVRTDTEDIRRWNYYLWRRGDTRMLEAWHIDTQWHEVYGKTHPEFFALRTDGTRAVGDRGRFTAYRCYTNDGGFQAHLEAIDTFYKTDGSEGRALFKANNREHGPNRRYIHWGVADAFRGCACEACRTLIERGGGDHSHLIWTYFLRLAREAAKRWPDKVLDTLAYSGYREIPDFVREGNPGNILIHDATMPEHGPFWVAYLKEPKVWQDASARVSRLAALAADGERPYLWVHYPHVPRLSNQQNIPYLVPHRYRDFILEHKDKISGMFFNGADGYSVALDGLVLYLVLKISWNPDLDVDACIDEFVRIFFGPAAEPAGEYYKAIIARWEDTRWGTLPKNNDQAKACYWKETYPRPVRDQLEATLRDVFAHTEDGTIYRARAQHLKEGTAPFFEQGRFYDLGKVYKHRCVRWTPKTIDGLLKEDYWGNGLTALRLHRNDNGEREEDVLKGQIYVIHDVENLYVAGRIDQTDDFITKTGGTAPRDSDIWATDSLELFLCTEQPGMAAAGEDQKSQFHQFIIDPHGSVWDGYRKDSGVNLDIEVKTINLKNRLFFEMKIPFRELGCVPPSDGSQWYMNLYWSRPRNGKHMGYAWAGRGKYHDTSRFGILEFSGETPTSRRK
ncbi:MAG: DUF4838 domain-containing protein [Lentisphaerae bacterium]|jgi:hypothetical protein|nr:DUF4838 domain-containing protein [Lentisphaerota bacterium]MBT5608855.1 DUF4838 domain-containing protein [Lentisphaerota bacterium]MBT7057178.1 DUF4838 domain-containing protein [Lentisphaerota bacterium]MBT7845062.1 DUF4838 domain-containing protein [Lentisphaerota bacterium]